MVMPHRYLCARQQGCSPQENENILVSSCGDGTVKVWDVAAPPASNPLRSYLEHKREVGTGLLGIAPLLGSVPDGLCSSQPRRKASHSAAPAELRRAGPGALPVMLGSVHAGSPVHLSSYRAAC